MIHWCKGGWWFHAEMWDLKWFFDYFDAMANPCFTFSANKTHWIKLNWTGLIAGGLRMRVGQSHRVGGDWSELGRQAQAGHWLLQTEQMGGALDLGYVEALRSTSVEFSGSLSSRVTGPKTVETEGRSAYLKKSCTWKPFIRSTGGCLTRPGVGLTSRHSFLVFLFNLL